VGPVSNVSNFDPLAVIWLESEDNSKRRFWLSEEFIRTRDFLVTSGKCRSRWFGLVPKNISISACRALSGAGFCASTKVGKLRITASTRPRILPPPASFPAKAARQKPYRETGGSGISEATPQ